MKRCAENGRWPGREGFSFGDSLRGLIESSYGWVKAVRFTKPPGTMLSRIALIAIAGGAAQFGYSEGLPSAYSYNSKRTDFAAYSMASDGIAYKQTTPGILDEFSWGAAKIPSRVYLVIPFFGDLGEEIVKTMREYHVVGASVGILDMKSGQIAFLGAFGYSDIAKRLPMARNTAILSGSVSKSLVGVACLRLYEQGKLDLNAGVLDLLKNAGIEPAVVAGGSYDPRLYKVQVRDLLNHTSGFAEGSLFNANPPVARMLGKDGPLTIQEMSSIILGRNRIDTEPGTSYRYNNCNFVLVGAIIEHVTGKSLDEALSELVFARMGMKPTDAFISHALSSPYAEGARPNEAVYYQRSGKLFDSIFNRGQRVSEPYGGWNKTVMGSTGSIALTLDGFLAFLSNMYSQRIILGPRARAALLEPPPHHPRDAEHFYTMGMAVNKAGAVKIGHGGMTLHAGAWYGHIHGPGQLENRYAVFLLSNWNNDEAPYVDSILSKAVQGYVDRRVKGFALSAEVLFQKWTP